MHISSLPSLWGIGTLGAEAVKFIDFLSKSGQSFWQVLPVSPTGFGDSPYQSYSSYAGNPYFIDLDLLCDWGLLEKSDYCELDWGCDSERADYGLLSENRYKVLRKACTRLFYSCPADYDDFCSSSAFWLDDYALFMALKESHGGASWTQWEAPLRFREDAALKEAKQKHESEIDFHKAVQYLFFRQWELIKSYAHKKGVSIIGDLPIYAAPDSADVWARPDLFMLDSELMPVEVAGCTPDGFTAFGQLWGNPLYNWDEHRKDGFSWWISRIKRQFELFDVLRIDHFRGFDAYYAIPFGAKDAKNGVWHEGPGMELFDEISRALGEKQIIAEDLGFLSTSVRELLRKSGFPGMKVLHFAFEGEDSDYLPHNYTRNCVAYTGTHDNNTTVGWFETAADAEVRKARDYLRIREGESVSRAMISALWGSVAELVIVPMQDILGLDGSARMNTPSTLGGNWKWRMKPGLELKEHSEWLRHITELYGRI